MNDDDIEDAKRIIQNLDDEEFGDETDPEDEDITEDDE